VGALTGMALTHWSPAAGQPEGYPERLPFVPNTPVEIRQEGSRVTMCWRGVDRPFDLLQQLIGASARDGWSRVPDEADAARTAPPQRVRFRSDAGERVIEVTVAGPFSSVSLTQSEQEPLL
jgi:hypothetical protein